MNQPVVIVEDDLAAQSLLLPTWRDASPAAPSALLIDPDPTVISASALHMLRQNGVAIDQVVSAEAAIEAVSRGRYRVVILELASAGYDGQDLCRRIVELPGPPVLVWSVKAAPLDQVAGLELGADDYVAKTAHPLELLARVRAILRRGRPAVVGSNAIGQTLGPASWLFEPRSNSIGSWSGVRVWLRPASSSLLELFCGKPSQQIDRESMLRGVSRGKTEVAVRTIDVMVSRLRRSLEACSGGGYLIRTVRPTGYLLDAAVEAVEGGLLIRG